MIYKEVLPGETSEGKEGKKPSSSVISGVAPEAARSHGELWSINYILEIVLSRGEGAGILYPSRNQLWATGRPGSLCDGGPKIPGTCRLGNSVYKSEPLKDIGSAVSMVTRQW